MPEFEKAGYTGNWLIGRKLNGDWGIVIVTKRRFDIDLASAECHPAEEQVPVRMTAEFEVEADPTGPVKRPSEIATEKRRVDIIVSATAYPPGNIPTPEFQVSVRIAGALEARLNVVGNRVAQWREPKWLTDKEKKEGKVQQWETPRFSGAVDVEKLPLSYRYAYGGKALLALEPDVEEQATAHQEEAAIVEKRNERKKEIVEELKAEEAKKEEAAAKKEAAKKAGHGIADEETAEKFSEAFGETEIEMRDPDADRMVLRGSSTEGGTAVIDVSDLEALVEEDRAAEPELQKVSKYAFGDEDARPEEEPAKDGTEDAEVDAEDKPTGGTQILDISALEGKDELKELLDERSLSEARKLKDGGKVLRDRATEFGDIELSDGAWIDEHGQRPAEVQAEEPEDDRPRMLYPYNPSGRGYCVSPLKEAVDGLKLPNLEWPDNPLLPDRVVQPLTEDFDLYALTTPAGMGPYPMGWFPRAGFAGCYSWDLDDAEKAKAQALAELDPDDPEDQGAIDAIGEMDIPVMQWQFFQEAHPRLQVNRINGDEEVLLTHLTPDGNLFFKLPGTHPDVTWNMGKGPQRVYSKLDQLLIDVDDPNKPAVELLWRGFYKLDRGPEELEGASLLHVDINNVEQHQWFDLLRDKEKLEEQSDAMGKSEGTMVIKAMDDEDLDADAFITGEEAWRRYRDEVQARKHVGAESELRSVVLKDGEVGQFKDDAGTAVFDQDQDRKLSDDWDVEIREQNQEWVERHAAEVEQAKALKLQAIRKQAREQADEEFGIVRLEVDEDGNPIDPDEPAGKKKKRKKKK